jgi:metallophosphoesterase superfamily enzyme
MTIGGIQKWIEESYREHGYPMGDDFTIREYTKEIEDSYEDWREYYDYPSCATHNIIIEGNHDNSIPYEVMQDIQNEAALGAYHIHCG